MIKMDAYEVRTFHARTSCPPPAAH